MKTIFVLAGICMIPFLEQHAVQAQTLSQQEFREAIPGDTLFNDVAIWSQFEDHRTGTAADSATFEWLAEKLGQEGYEVEFQEFPVPLFSFEGAEFEVDGEAIACFPIWTPATTGETPVSGPLVLWKGNSTSPTDLSGKVVLLTPLALTMREFEGAMQAMQAGAKGVVITYPHPAGVLAAVNCPDPFLNRQLPVPIILVGEQEAARLKKKAAENARASIRIDGQFNPDARARNLIARLDHGKEKWVVLSTPATGWFQCVGERGTGVGVLLGMARWAARYRDDVNWMIGITTGHELGHAGIMHLLDSGILPGPGSTATFVSLGASVAARDWEKTATDYKPLPRLSQQLRLVATTSLAGPVATAFEGLLPARATDQPEGGELSHVMKLGYPAIGLYGGHLWFHTVRDDLETTDPQLLGSVTHALAKSLDLILADK